MTRPPRHIAFLWDQATDYHMDRVEAVARALGDGCRVTLIEVTSRSRVYDWPECRPSNLVRRITLFPERDVEDVTQIGTARAIGAAVRRERIELLFQAGYQHPARFALAVWYAITGRKPVIMLDSKFDDKPRRLRLEALKRLLLMPYRAGLVSGCSARDYLRFLGFKRRPIALGYDTVSMDRMRALAPAADAPAWEERPFLVVARMIPEKNLGMAVRAFAALGRSRRTLRICGDGPLRPEMEALIAELGIGERVTLLGSVSQAIVAAEMARALCLILPSRSETWGLVVNEALAFDLPIIASEAVGARDALIATLANGFILNSEDLAAWTAAMQSVDRDETLWNRFRQGSRERAGDADVSAFTRSALQLMTA